MVRRRRKKILSVAPTPSLPHFAKSFLARHLTGGPFGNGATTGHCDLKLVEQGSIGVGVRSLLPCCFALWACRCGSLFLARTRLTMPSLSQFHLTYPLAIFCLALGLHYHLSL